MRLLGVKAGGKSRQPMPIYEYACQKCKQNFELLRLGGEDESIVRCPKCQGVEVERILSVFSSSVGRSADASCGPSGST